MPTLITVGLTGSIASGKSVTGAMLRRLGIPVHDADRTVHRLLAAGGAAVGPVSQLFPDVLKPDGAIDRAALGKRVFGDRAALRRLEAILHPLVRRQERHFLAAARARHEPIAVLDIPLLFETGGKARCDAVIVVSAPDFLLRARALRRPGMTADRLEAILRLQVPDKEKRRRTPYVIDSGIGRRPALRQLLSHLAAIRRRGVDTHGLPRR